MSFLWIRSKRQSQRYLFRHAMICQEPKTTRDCSVSKTTNNMISFLFFISLFHIQGKNNHNLNVF